MSVGEDWEVGALCAQVDVGELFFPEKGGSTREAKKICSLCEVREPCLLSALAREERFGIFGGYSERERRRISRGEVVALSTPPPEPKTPKPHGLRNVPKPRTGRRCSHCGDGFLGKTTAKYCSRVCYRKAEAERYNAKRRRDAA